MEKVVIATLLVSLLGLCLCHSSLKVYYVKPAGPSSSSSSSSGCPSGSSPCHSLQYYVNNSNFTNNSLFLFLPGEHHLDSVVDISKVTNLSLEGVSSGAKIFCNSFPSGFNITEFSGLRFKKITLTNCIQSAQVTLHLKSGSELNVDNITISSTSEYATGLQITSVTGLLMISNSFFPATQGGSIDVKYENCNQLSYFNFSNNEVKMEDDSKFGFGLSVHIHCSDVYILVADSIFPGQNDTFFTHHGFTVNFCELTNISVLVSNCSFKRSEIWVSYNYGCKMENTYCSSELINFTQITVTFFEVSLPSNCTFIIEDSLIIYDISSNSEYDSKQSMSDASIQAKFNNVTFIVAGCQLSGIAALIINCTFENNTESAILAWSSKLIFQGYNIFRNNTALIGAGMRLVSSYMFLQPHTYILFENNHAYYAGGGIYINSQESDLCFFHIMADQPPLNNTIKVNFINNNAGFGGFSLYGNNVAKCSNLQKFFINASNTESIPSAIASDPTRVCFCEDGRNQPNCSLVYVNKYIQAFPGENIILRLAIVGNDRNSVVTGVIRAFVDPGHYFSSSSSVSFGPLQSSQTAHRPYCENFTYTVYSTDEAQTLFVLTTELQLFKNIQYNDPTNLLTVHVILLKCPVGFFLSNTTGKCDCDCILKNNGIKCDINTQNILRPANTWIGFINMSDTPEVIFHPHCPIGYCLPYDTNITSNTSDSQCAPHRTGLLCGKCEEGYSLTLGNGTCIKCSNTYLLLILPLAVSGLLLVAILFALNLTVTEGTINGLIFYANVVSMNHSILYSGEASWLYKFLAWLNLDLGTTTCFYDGMDGYAETWLQFIFPIYLWMIVLMIIKLYNRFPSLANRLGGGNAVKVLATLLILSYTKLQRTVVTIMSFTTLEYPDGSIRYVWLYDANLDYFKGKHLYLGIAGIFALVFLILPYTLCLVFFQQLQACSNYIPFRWVNKLKPLFDSYAGPYKDKYRFWTGMLLLVRTLLIVLFTVNMSGLVEFNLLIILMASLALALANSNGTYKKWPLNYLEVFSYLQLGVFAGGMMYAKLTSGNVSIVANISTSLSLAEFLIVMGYHFLLSLKALKGYCYHVMGYAEIAEDGNVSLTHERFVN